MRSSLSTVFGLLVMCLVGLIGCGKSKTNAPTGGETAAAPRPHHHHHGDARGPHGGRIIGLDIDSYHGELTHDAASNRVGVYILGDDAATAAPIEAASVTINATVDDKPTQFTLTTVAQPGDAAGKSSYFELVSEPLLAVVTGQSQSPNNDVQLSMIVDGKTHVGDIDTTPAIGLGASSGSADDDALVWHKEISEQGYDIALGHHGVTLLAGSTVEPAVQVMREGQPVADAQVFNVLLADDGQTVLAEEVATVYEPPTSDEPSHYAQGPLKIPAGTRAAMIRYRIVLPEGKGERTFDVPVAVK